MDVSGPTAQAVVAVIQADVLVRCFVIALVIMIPFWLHQRRKLRDARSPATVDAAGRDPAVGDHSVTGAGPPPRLEDVVASLDGLAVVARRDGSVPVDVPDGVTIDGSPSDRATIDVVLHDALRRSGLVAVSETDSAAGRTLECRPSEESPR